MKLTDLLVHTLARPNGRQAKKPADSKAGSFEGELQSAAKGEAHSSRRSSSSSASHPEDALLLAQAAATRVSRPAQLIDTKAANLKGELKSRTTGDAAAGAPAGTSAASHATPDALAALISHRAQSTPHQLRDATPAQREPERTPAVKAARDDRDERLALPTTGGSPPSPTLATPMIDAAKFEGALQAASAPADAAPLSHVAPMMLEDPSARAVLLPTVARLAVDTGDAGKLTVQLKVNDGVTEIRAAGPAAALLEARQGELRVALAHEGLSLGQFDLTQSGRDQHHAPADVEEGAPLAPRAATTSRSTEAVVEDGRLHVKA
ncbi:MAG: flagellar hook-length control protein FliK [Myxococcaceae bacterium]